MDKSMGFLGGRSVKEKEMRYKQVILVREDLGMSKGKTCAQVAHASLGSAELAMKKFKSWYEAWKKEGQKKVVLRVKDERDLRYYYEKAKENKLPCYLVVDAGLTELPPDTSTALAIGPAPNEKIDKITGKLKLL